jgi:hypothetical protein
MKLNTYVPPALQALKRYTPTLMTWMGVQEATMMPDQFGAWMREDDVREMVRELVKELATPECDCEGGPQDDGLCSLPHEPAEAVTCPDCDAPLIWATEQPALALGLLRR